MLWAALSKDGFLFEFDPSLTGRGRPLPGRFRAAESVLDFAEERFEFRRVGRVAFRLLERGRGWRSQSTRILLSVRSGELLMRDDAILVVRGSVSEMGEPIDQGVSGQVKRAFVTPAVRTFLLLRRAEVKAWRQRGHWLELFCIATAENLLVPTAKVVFRVRGSGTASLRQFISSVQEVRDLAALDAQFDLRLPSVRRGPLQLLAPLLVGIFGMFGSLLTALAFAVPGSPSAIAMVGAGIVVLFGGLLGFLVLAARTALETKRIRPKLQRELEARSLQTFEEGTTKLARDFVEACARTGIGLDFTVGSLVRLPGLEAQVPRQWRPTVYRYAAYLGEVLIRDLGPRMRTEWVRVGGGVFLRSREAGIEYDILGYVTSRLGGTDASSALAKLREWRWVATLAQSAQPIELFVALGIHRDRILRSPDVLSEIVAEARRGEGRTIVRPFGSFSVHRSAVLPGLWIQYQGFLRDEAGERIEEPRCLRPVFSADRTQECVILEAFELPCGGESIIVGDYGGAPGQPLIISALATDHLAQPFGSLGPGQRRTVALGGIVLGGEAVPPTSGTPAIRPSSYGSIQPANPSQAVDPRFRFVGTVEDVRTMMAEPPGPSLTILDLNVRGLRIPVLAEVSRVRGTPTPGCGFNGEIWLELQFRDLSEPKHRADVA